MKQPKVSVRLAMAGCPCPSSALHSSGAAVAATGNCKQAFELASNKREGRQAGKNLEQDPQHHIASNVTS